MAKAVDGEHLALLLLLQWPQLRPRFEALGLYQVVSSMIYGLVAICCVCLLKRSLLLGCWALGRKFEADNWV